MMFRQEKKDEKKVLLEEAAPFLFYIMDGIKVRPAISGNQTSGRAGGLLP